MCWIQTYTGRKFFPLDPVIESIDIADIAHALSMMCRYGGHCDRFYSVGEHSVLLSRCVPQELALWALLHDASEAYLVDVPSPLKPYLPGYADIERKLERAVAARFGLCWPMPEEIKFADTAIRTDEMQALMKSPPEPWPGMLPALGLELPLWGQKQAKAEFLQRFYELT